MPDSILREILLVCVSIEKKAAEIYLEISGITKIEDQKGFWMDVSSDEKRHLDYWEALLVLEKRGILVNPFDHPNKAKAELDAMLGRMDEFQAEKMAFSNISEAILLAFQLESFMLHPAFFVFFRSFKQEMGGKSPEDEYEEHVYKFVQFVEKHLANKPGIKLIGDMLSRMLRYGREVADQFEQIKTLRGLIPICAKCKKIRNDQGYWSDIEYYLGERSEAKFTHGICPECKKELYPELSQI